ncbi:unnamed protein product [Paramecium pentaurelia]|uniref:1-phosphatidylinositol-3-phosphate 5-kinase n=1 Tax=Paramecium pentaurelia TaxID=43138 RepID=A0A8S1UH46_9CILI|nr:unnamed protein product [Paramecium pentaurelia]
MKQASRFDIIKNELIPKKKWKEDQEINQCGMCDNKFNALFRRKHHCRRCGYIFCQDCSNHFIDGSPNEGEKKIRFCRRCYDKINQLIADKGFFVENEDTTLKGTVKKEGNSHSKNASKQFDSVTTFTSSKSIIVKGNEAQQFQEEDDTLLEINQEKEDISEFFEDSDIAKDQLTILQERSGNFLEKICEYILQNVLQPNKPYEKVIEFWKSKMKLLITQCIQEIQFHSLNTNLMDINHFMKIKIIDYHDEQLTSFFPGVIFRKNVALKQMQSEINKPVIIIIIGDFDMDGSQNQLEDYIQNEKKILVESINQIYKNYEPNLILVEKGANKIALDECLKKKITVLTNVKKKVLKRVKLCTNAKFINLSTLKLCIDRKEQIVGRCEKVFFKSFPKLFSDKSEMQKDSTLCFLKTSQCQKFATITLSGPSEELLCKLKQCFIGCARLGKHQDLESHFITTECSMFKNNQLKTISNQGNFTTFLFEKVPLKELFIIELKYIKINYVIADVSNFNDIKDFSSLEEYKSKHPSQRDKLEEFSMARMCNKPQEKKSVFYHGEDVCLGQFIILKIANKDNKCEFCHLPKIAHVSFYYCGDKYIKISVDQKNRSGRVISTNEPPQLSNQVSQQFSQLSNEDEVRDNVYTAKDISKIVQQSHSNQKGEKKKIKIETYIQCSKCDLSSNIVKLSSQNLEFSFFRFMQTILITQPNINDRQTTFQLNACNHQLQRIFTYDESMVKIQVGDVEVFSTIIENTLSQEILDNLKKWEEEYIQIQKKELYQRYLNIIYQLTQIKKSLSKTVDAENIEKYTDEKSWQEKFSGMNSISDLQQFTYTLSTQLQEIGDQIKAEMKKFQHKNSMIRSQKELDHLSPINKGHSSGQDCETIHSDSVVGDDIEHQSEQLGDIKSPMGGKPIKTSSNKIPNIQYSVKDLDNHSFIIDKQQNPFSNFLKEWPLCLFLEEQNKVALCDRKIIPFVAIFESQPLSSLAFALNHPNYLKAINYYENFSKADQEQQKIVLSKLMLIKSGQQSGKWEQEDQSLPRESQATTTDTNLNANQQQSIPQKKEKNYITITLQYDKVKGMKPSMSRDQFQDEDKTISSQQSITSGLGNQQFSVKKSKTQEILIYFPTQFEALRASFGITLNLFIKSLSVTGSWNASGGKSSSKFFKSDNELFVVKKFDDEKEFRMFEQFALDYFRQMHRHFYESQKPSLLCKIFGMYEIRDKGSPEFYLIMENLYYGIGNQKDLLVYDLKGSETNRWEKKVNKVLLDTNFIIDRNAEPILIQNECYIYNDKAFQSDCKFLLRKQIVDYSLLLIINNKQKKIKMGIIDYLRFYTWDKETERLLKFVLKGGKVPTIINPHDYKQRFLTAIGRYFIHV